MARDAGPANATATPTSTAAGKKAATSTPVASATQTVKSESGKALEFSMGGLMCAFLALSTLVL